MKARGKMLRGMLFLVLFSFGSIFNAAAAAKPKKIKAERISYGLCSVDVTEEVALETSPTGSQNVTSGFRLVKRTNRVPAELGQRFGVEYIIRADPGIEEVEVECVWVYPTPVTNPEGQVFKEVRYTSVKSTNYISNLTYSLDKEYEVVKGKWLLQLYYKKVKIFEQAFFVE